MPVVTLPDLYRADVETLWDAGSTYEGAPGYPRDIGRQAQRSAEVQSGEGVISPEEVAFAIAPADCRLWSAGQRTHPRICRPEPFDCGIASSFPIFSVPTAHTMPCGPDTHK